jgi:ParB family chromosome partitioning protein
MLGTDQLQAGAFQPRRNFDADELKALAQSFGKSGILQPLVVRPLKGKTDQFEIIAGERRWRAAQIAKLHAVPVVVQELSDSEALEIGIIENVQRADLNPIEESEAYQRLIDEFSYTQAELAEVVGKSRSHIANLLRLGQATPGMRDLLVTGALSMGHARALLGHPDADALARCVVAEGLSVRAVEALAGGKSDDKSATKSGGKGVAKPDAKDADTRAVEKTLADGLGLKVDIRHQGDESGTLTISYKRLSQLDDVIARLLSNS